MKITEIIGEPRLIEKIENGRLVARLPDGSPPPFVFRVMSIKEYQMSMQQGFFQSRERTAQGAMRPGRTHAAIKPLLQFCEPGPVNALVQISYSDDDGWQPKWMGDQLVVITHQPINAQKIKLIAQGTRADLIV